MTRTAIPRRFAVALASAVVALVVAPATAFAADTLVVVSSGTISMPAGSQGTLNGVDQYELRGPNRAKPGLAIPGPGTGARTIATTSGSGTLAAAGKKAKSQPVLLTDWLGLNHRDTRLADGGNQFSGEPPDQGLCAGNGFVLESVNAAVRVYDTSGTPLGDVVSLNEFYGLPPAIDRSTFTFPGPLMFDIECHFDPASQRWFHLSASIEQDPTTGATPGENDINLAVSKSANPLGEWAIYRIPGQNDGTEGTPDHDCAGGPCFADFPHLGVDANGVYITTNEFPFFEAGFIGAQIYAISKQVLVSTPMSISITLINTADDPVKPDQPGFTVWPAKSAGAQFAGAANGTEFFLSSNAAFNDNGESDELIVWALTNTQSLDSGTPSLQLRKTIVPVNRYAVPSNSAQKPGTTPLRDCLNDRSHALGRGQNCWELFFATRPAFQPLGTIDNGDSRVLDVRFANGRLWGVLGTAAEVDGRQRTGAGWYILDAAASSSGVSASVAKQGILALADASLAYPTVGVTTSGRGVLGFSLVGENNFPSAAFAPIDAVVGAGAVSVSEEGKSPQDGFSEYPVFGSPRPRWGDYSASAVDGDTVYSATEYIEQGPCTLGEYLATGLTCTGERTSLANWATRVSKLKP